MPNTSKITLGTEMLETACVVCGTTFEQKYNGRTREYCNDNCRDYKKFFNALSKVIDKVNFQDYRYVKSIKSDLFGLNNHMPKRIIK